MALNNHALTSRFVVEIDSKELVFMSIGGLGVSTTPAETGAFVPGGRSVVKNPGNQEPTELTLKRQVDGDKYVWDWFKDYADGKTEPKNGSVVVYGGNDGKKEIRRFNFMGAWPSKVSVSGFDASSKDTLTEECTLVCYDFKRVK